MKNIFRKSYIEINYLAEDLREVQRIVSDLGYEVVGATKYNADTTRVTETLEPRNPLRHARVHDLSDKFDEMGLSGSVNVCWC